VKIQVLGPGCSRCKQLTLNAEQAVRELGLDVRVEKIQDYQAIAVAGVMSTPALAVDGQIKVAGKVVSAEEIKHLLRP
jgi:small redox-active disulfide protein 2